MTYRIAIGLIPQGASAGPAEIRGNSVALISELTIRLWCPRSDYIVLIGYEQIDAVGAPAYPTAIIAVTEELVANQ